MSPVALFLSKTKTNNKAKSTRRYHNQKDNMEPTTSWLWTNQLLSIRVILIHNYWGRILGTLTMGSCQWPTNLRTNKKEWVHLKAFRICRTCRCWRMTWVFKTWLAALSSRAPPSSRISIPITTRRTRMRCTSKKCFWKIKPIWGIATILARFKTSSTWWRTSGILSKTQELCNRFSLDNKMVSQWRQSKPIWTNLFFCSSKIIKAKSKIRKNDIKKLDAYTISITSNSKMGFTISNSKPSRTTSIPKVIFSYSSPILGTSTQFNIPTIKITTPLPTAKVKIRKCHEMWLWDQAQLVVPALEENKKLSTYPTWMFTAEMAPKAPKINKIGPRIETHMRVWRQQDREWPKSAIRWTVKNISLRPKLIKWGLKANWQWTQMTSTAKAPATTKPLCLTQSPILSWRRAVFLKATAEEDKLAKALATQ